MSLAMLSGQVCAERNVIAAPICNGLLLCCLGLGGIFSRIKSQTQLFYPKMLLTLIVLSHTLLLMMSLVFALAHDLECLKVIF